MNEQDIWAEWRMEVQEWHPTPDRFVTLACLATEVGEALDTGIRLLNALPDRTHDHGRNLGRELAQIIDLANTAAIQHNIYLEEECRAWRDEVRNRRPNGGTA